MKTWVSLRHGPVFLTAAMGCLWSCSSPTNDPESTVPGKCINDAPLLAPQKTDILFVIDNSGSMAEEQQGIANELPAFLEELQKGGGVAQDFQVGLITTTVYQNAEVNGTTTFAEYPAQAGKLQPIPVINPDGSVSAGTDHVLHGDDPNLLAKFRELIKQGTGGSGQETPFEAVRLALLSQPPLAENQGLLRDGARLLVVIVTDEDDCSETVRPPQVKVGNLPSRDYCSEQASKLTPVSTYYKAFTELTDSTGAPRAVIWAVIGPVSQTDKSVQAVVENGSVRNVDCPTSFQPGYRHWEMATLFDPSRTNLDSICRANYRESLLTIAALANQKQDLEISNVPNSKLLKVEITRSSGKVDLCTELNDGIRYTPGVIHFQNDCLRRGDDTAVTVKLLCAS